jgi:hypothetical protein
VREAVAEARELVTFNGRTFDLPLLETRYLLARASWWGAELPHRDLYPVARALWRGRAGDCRLSTLEAALLGLDRGDDLPGALVPQVYFRYLRTRDPGALPRVFAHNRWDLVALAGLHARAAAPRGPDPQHDPRVDGAGAGSSAGARPKRALHEALSGGAAGGFEPAPPGARMARRGRAGPPGPALWAEAVARVSDHPSDS